MKLAKVNLKELAQELQVQSEGYHGFLHKPTGELVGVTDEMFAAAEDDVLLDDYPEWEREGIELAKRINETDGYIRLPGKLDIHEYSMMEDFCLSIEDEKTRNLFLRGIRGKGAFGRFRDFAETYGLMDDWYGFRDEAYEEFAKNWCEENDIAYTNERQKKGESHDERK